MKTNFMQSVKTSDKTQRVLKIKVIIPESDHSWLLFYKVKRDNRLIVIHYFFVQIFSSFSVLYKFQFVRNDKQCIVAQLSTSKSLCVYICRINKIWSQQTIIPHECCFSNWSKFQIDKSINFVCKIR